MRTVRLTDKWSKNDGCVMLLGGFDGLHVGHKKLLERAKTFGLPIGIMTISGGKGERNLFTEKEREHIFRNSGIDFSFILPFAEIKDMSPLDFVSLLQTQFHVQAFVCGTDFRFGKQAQGTPKILKDATQVCVEVENLLQIDGEKASASIVKTALQDGNVEKAERVLGERFFLLGEVEKGRSIGKTLGFPTANVAYPQEKIALKQGVYQTEILVDGKQYKGITNYGARPTFNNEQVLTETYLDAFDGDLYGKTIEIRFVRFIRDVQKFPSVQALQVQLQKDIRSVRTND